MPKFTIEVRETLSRLIEVEADTVKGAIDIVNNRYNNSDIILDSDDCQDVDIEEYNCG